MVQGLLWTQNDPWIDVGKGSNLVGRTMGKEAIHVLPSWLQEVEIGEEEGELIGIVLSDLWLKRKTLGLEPLSDGAGLCFKIPSLKRTRWGQMGSAQDPLSRTKTTGALESRVYTACMYGML